jgi:hypothetical protein
MQIIIFLYDILEICAIMGACMIIMLILLGIGLLLAIFILAFNKIKQTGGKF